MKIKFYPHQIKELTATDNLTRVAYYHDMGLGKTFVGAEKLIRFKTKVNLVVCQKSKIQDWIDHFKSYYDFCLVTDLTKISAEKINLLFMNWCNDAEEHAFPHIYIINYDLIFRRPILKKLTNFTLLLDESSLIQNENAKRSRFILNLKPKNVILLSGTPTGGKYERLLSQMNLLGWKISKEMFYNQYVDYHWDDSNGFPLMVIDGYKNEERLKRKMRQYGCRFLKTDEVFDLPVQSNITIKIPITTAYKKFHKDSIISIGDIELIGDTSLSKMLYERQLCGHYNPDKLKAFEDLLMSTDDRIIVFYNFWDELSELEKIAQKLNRPCSYINGSLQSLTSYEHANNSITFVQYQAGSMGLNLQLANKIIYFTPPLSSELFEQSKKRIHRIGQEKPCFYYYLCCKNSIEEKIYSTLAMRKNYTEALFENGS